MAAAATYEPIATQNMAGISSVTFSSLGSYTDIVIVGANLTNSTGTSTFLQFNNDSGANYCYVYIRGNGSNAASSRANSQTSALIANGIVGLDTTPTMVTTQVFNYSSATSYKTIVSRSTDAAGASVAITNSWRSTAAVTSITLFSSVNFTTGNFTLYGIKAA
jgi:hypothetical protein